MPIARILWCACFALTGAVALTLFACTSEKLVFREPFNPPPDNTNKFLGYFTATDKQTSCGNCHVEKQADWTTTKHSQAWGDLVASGHQTAECNSCHSVSERGNATTAPAGYSAVADTAYQDVQCESCHGPGFDHASSPTLANRPLASVSISSDPAAWVESSTCGSCHTGDFSPFVEQWSQSAHAHTVTEVIDEYVADPVGRASCAACHEGRNVLKAWGVQTNYVEVNDAITAENALPTTCAVCHDPHAKNHEGQLRWAVDNPDPDQNLCMKCHNRRTEPQATSARGPHAPQGGVLLGTAGYWPAGFDTTALIATHGNVTLNTRLCAGCHVAPFTVTDASGNVVFQSVGHLFNPDPCLDAQGKPLGDNTCPRPGDPSYASGSRKFAACVQCHGSEATTENAFESNRNAVRVLADELWLDANGNQILYDTTTAADPGGSGLPKAFDPGDTGLLTQVPVTEFNYKDKVITDAEGVLFNVRLVGENRYANGDRSFGVHNPLLAKALLTASIDALKAKFGLSVSPQAQAIMNQVESRIPRARPRLSVGGR